MCRGEGTRNKNLLAVKFRMMDTPKSRTQRKIGGVIHTYIVAYAFSLAQNVVTGNDLERRNGRYFALFRRTR